MCTMTLVEYRQHVNDRRLKLRAASVAQERRTAILREISRDGPSSRKGAACLSVAPVGEVHHLLGDGVQLSEGLFFGGGAI